MVVSHFPNCKMRALLFVVRSSVSPPSLSMASIPQRWCFGYVPESISDNLPSRYRWITKALKGGFKSVNGFARLQWSLLHQYGLCFLWGTGCRIWRKSFAGTVRKYRSHILAFGIPKVSADFLWIAWMQVISHAERPQFYRVQNYDPMFFSSESTTCDSRLSSSWNHSTTSQSTEGPFLFLQPVLFPFGAYFSYDTVLPLPFASTSCFWHEVVQGACYQRCRSVLPSWERWLRRGNKVPLSSWLLQLTRWVRVKLGKWSLVCMDTQRTKLCT